MVKKGLSKKDRKGWHCDKISVHLKKFAPFFYFTDNVELGIPHGLWTWRIPIPTCSQIYWVEGGGGQHPLQHFNLKHTKKV